MDRWCELRGIARGSVLSLDQCWQLARHWYQGRLELDWLRPSVERMEAIFAEVGLAGPFWSLR